jgi:hypothetical protein
VDNRACFQKIEAELPVAFFLFGYRKWNKNAGMVHLDSPFVAQRNPSLITNEEGLLNRSSLDPHPFDKPFGRELGSNRRTASIRQTDRE